MTLGDVSGQHQFEGETHPDKFIADGDAEELPGIIAGSICSTWSGAQPGGRV